MCLSVFECVECVLVRVWVSCSVIGCNVFGGGMVLGYRLK